MLSTCQEGKGFPYPRWCLQGKSTQVGSYRELSCWSSGTESQADTRRKLWLGRWDCTGRGRTLEVRLDRPPKTFQVEH